jgi:hypothetical protein
MYKCSRCGNELRLGGLFVPDPTSCPRCGAYLDPASVKEAVRGELWGCGATAGIVSWFLLMFGIGLSLVNGRFGALYVLLFIALAIGIAVLTRFTRGWAGLISLLALVVYAIYLHSSK